MAELLLNHPKRIRSAIPLEITWIDLSKELSLVTTNAEMVASYGLFIKDKFKGQVLPIGYTNGMIGYVPTAKQISEGGYESKESVFYFVLPALFDPVVEERIYNALQSLAKTERID